MTTIFVAGSMHIKRLDGQFVERLQSIAASKSILAVGDANGADAAIQQVLSDAGAKAVTIYCTGGQPRNNVGNWPVHVVQSGAKAGTREYFTAKDVKMAEIADSGFMVWDTKSTGTLSNVIELVKRNKQCVVYVNKDKVFMTIFDIEDLERLISRMSDSAREAAEDKISLSHLLANIAHKQYAVQV